MSVCLWTPRNFSLPWKRHENNLKTPWKHILTKYCTFLMIVLTLSFNCILGVYFFIIHFILFAKGVTKLVMCHTSLQFVKTNTQISTIQALYQMQNISLQISCFFLARICNSNTIELASYVLHVILFHYTKLVMCTPYLLKWAPRGLI